MKHLRTFHAQSAVNAYEQNTDGSSATTSTRPSLDRDFTFTSSRKSYEGLLIGSGLKDKSPSDAALEELEKMKTEERVVLNVGGAKFETYRSTLTAYPDTLLGQLFLNESKIKEGKEFFFDRDSNIFKYVMQFYRHGRITWPTSSLEPTMSDIKRELDFFKIQPSKGRANLLDMAGFKVDSFVDMLAEAILEARINFKARIDFKFYSSGRFPAEVDPKLPSITHLIPQFDHVGYSILNFRRSQVAKILANNQNLNTGGLKVEINHFQSPQVYYKISLNTYHSITVDAVRNSTLTFPKRADRNVRRENESQERDLENENDHQVEAQEDIKSTENASQSS
ncbi:7284_t:CDS:2 [Dentiscutata heterogama]|uniref:7284_t:CDS:1 n=1 Tax=Dentiscutata heterogama TaxID=1316150 RepID=A0ACA9ML79_9GLOM|nr:7284_t:CDS:2 [Dentiscutata heterogama]